MPFPLWLFMRLILCHEVFTKLFLWCWQYVLRSTNAIDGIWMRKLYMEQQVRQFLERHMATSTYNNALFLQVLVIGAGYDTLAYRLALEYQDSNVAFIELDHPATGQAKLAALKRYCCSSKHHFQQRKKRTTTTSYPTICTLVMNRLRNSRTHYQKTQKFEMHINVVLG